MIFARKLAEAVRNPARVVRPSGTGHLLSRSSRFLGRILK
jgi:hypothetical protein